MFESFDVFETCLVRRVAEPCEVFGLVGEAQGLGDGFRYRREEAEVEARKNHGGEVTLRQIYDVLAEWLSWDEAQLQRVMEAELAEESKQLQPIPEMRDHCDLLREQRCKIGFLSDMYLPGEFIEERLRAHGFFKDGDRLWVSGECGASKASGTLYERVRKELGLGSWSHWGNHAGADVLMAEKHGVKGCHFDAGNLNRYERLMSDYGDRGCRAARVMAGLSRLARLEGEQVFSKDSQAISRVSSGVAGPMVLSFVTWLVDRAVSHGVDEVYFLARDGQCLMEPFEAVARSRGLSLKARYLYASRISLRFPRSFPMSDEAAAGVFQECHGVIPVAGVAARLGLTVSELRELIPGKLDEESISKQAVQEIRAAMAQPEVEASLQAKAEERERLLSGYLKQEGLMSTEHALVVDLGWAGSLQAGLCETLGAAGSSVRVTGLYLGLTRSVTSADLAMESYLFDAREGQLVPCGSWLTTLAESFCQADHGSTMGFEEKDGVIVPELDVADGQNPRVAEWLKLHRSAIGRFVGLVCDAGEVPKHPGELKPLLIGLLLKFWAKPDRSEADVWGEHCFASAGVSDSGVALAPRPVSPRDWCWVMGSSLLGVGKSLWREGSAERLPEPFPKIAGLLRRAKRVERKRFHRTSMN